MHIVAIAWIFVVVLMALAEATSSQGTLLGALFTLLLYGALPLSIVMYLLGTPARRRARRRAEAQAEQSPDQSPSQESSQSGDGRGHAAGGPVSPIGKEP